MLLRIFTLTIVAMQLAEAQQSSSPENLATDYAFLSLLTLTPDFSAANYKIEQDPVPSVTIRIVRLPFVWDVADINDKTSMGFELSLGYQKTEETVPVLDDSSEYIDAKWQGTGVSLGLLFDHRLSKNVTIEPKIRAGIVRLVNDARYYGEFTNSAVKSIYDGSLFNWDTKASVVSLGLGLVYDWQVGDRDSTVKAYVYHLNMDSFDESNQAVAFNTNANLASLKADVIIPTSAAIFDKQLDIVLLGGSSLFFGENRNTLGFASIYEAGLGLEYPIKGDKFSFGYVRLSGLLSRGENVRGWSVSLDYHPK